MIHPNHKYAVIDLGTNTFHALIVEKHENGSFVRLYKERIYVKLAEEGIEKIGSTAFSRAIFALTKLTKNNAMMTCFSGPSEIQ